MNTPATRPATDTTAAPATAEAAAAPLAALPARATAAAIALPGSPRPALPGGLSSLAAPGLLLAALAAAALLLARRRRAAPRLVEVIESTSLGPKRALVVVRLNGETLLLGSSEAGIALLRAQPAPPLAAALEPAPAPPPSGARALASVVARLVPARRAVPPEARFEALLADSAEDQDLRRKLALGKAGTVR